MNHSSNCLNRRGSVYLAVLGTAMVASVLAFSALAMQRVQNRVLTAAADIRQAQLNAESAMQLGILAAQDPAGISNQVHDMGDAGTCEVEFELLDDDTYELQGVGRSGSSTHAVQPIAKIVDVYPQSLECLYSSVAAGGDIALNGATLRANNLGLITANAISVFGSNVYGRVQATAISGSAYRNPPTQITAADRPTMPNWSTVFDYYRNNGTEIPVGLMDTSAGNQARNGGFEQLPASPVPYWTGTPPNVATAAIARTTSPSRSGLASLRVSARTAWNSGASQSIEGFVKPNQSYTISAYVNLVPAPLLTSRNFRIRLTTKGTDSSEQNVNSGDFPVTSLNPVSNWVPISATLTAAPWSGDLEYAFIKIAWSDSSSSAPYYDFLIDDVSIMDTTTGRFIYRDTLGPGVNTVAGSPNALGLYYINCAGNRIIIERSRIKGTLLLINPGAGSMIGTGPINWTPSIPGFPALLVDANTAANANFTIAATGRRLSEAEDGVNYNPAGMSHEIIGYDNNEQNDIYPSEIQGLILVRNNLTFQNNSLVRGSVIAGGNVTASSGSLEVNYRPDALYNPPPGLEAAPKHVVRPLSTRKAVMP